MAERNIAFTVQLNGTQQVFNSIKEFEDALRSANIELKNFTGGADDFKKLQDEIKKAESELNKIKEGAKGLTVNKQISEFLKFGQVVTGAFGAATTALSLFGMENEDVTQAAAKAQQILTLQYSLVTLAKEKDTIATAFNTASTIANTLATQGLRAALTLLFTTMKANPFGAFLTILSLVVGALVLFTDETEDATKAEENFQKTLQKGQVQRQRNIQLLQAQGKTEVEIAQASMKAAEDRFRMAQFYYLNTSKDAELFAKVEEEFETAKFERTLAQINLEQAQERARKQNQENDLDRVEKLRKEQERLNEIRRREIELAVKAYQVRNQVSLLGKQIGDDEAELVETLEKRLGTIRSLAIDEDKYLTVREKLNKVIEENKPLDDSYAVVFERLRIESEDYFNQLSDGAITSEKAVTDLRNFTIKLFEETKGALDPRQLDDFFFYTEEYVRFFEQGQKLLASSSKETKDIILKEFEQAVIDLQLLNGQITFDPFSEGGYTGNASGIRSQQELLDDLTTAEQRYAQVINSLEKQFARTLRSQEQFKDATDEELKPVIDEQIKAFVQLSSNILKYENDVSLTTLSIQKLNEELAKATPEAREGIILSNLDNLVKQIKLDFSDIINQREFLGQLNEEIATKNYDLERNYAEEVLNLQLMLSEKIPGFAELTYEAKLEVLRAYLQYEVDETDKAEKKKQDSQQKTIDKILEQIQLFQTALQAVQQTVSDYYNFQFDQLEKRNKRIQDSIVGESERANQLRLEADKAYTAERERLEKQQAKIQLRLTLAQTIANVAQAIAQSLGNPILAGIVGAAGAVQIALVSQQLATIDAYNRGGRLKKKSQGGLVVGPSHEMGGVKFQGGGVELEGNEAIINRLSTLRYADILSSINIAGGGNPIVMSNFDDSRIVEAIAKQRQTPIRAFVVESDITNAQTINKRLELLSQI
jgi:hypothetical protein